jgi:hypothetical protein
LPVLRFANPSLIIICAAICPPMNPSVNACNAGGSERPSYSGVGTVEGQHHAFLRRLN